MAIVLVDEACAGGVPQQHAHALVQPPFRTPLRSRQAPRALPTLLLCALVLSLPLCTTSSS